MTLYTQKLGWYQAVYNTDTGILTITSSIHSEDDFSAMEVIDLALELSGNLECEGS